jgi:alpha-1,3-glucosyltransferase
MQRIISASMFLHPGFIIIDHIHFQYNGFMYGILLWSILMARNVGKQFFLLVLLLISCAGEQTGIRHPFRHPTEFQTHIHVSCCKSMSLAFHKKQKSYISQPAYFVYLLRTYCMSPAGELLPVRLLSLANAVILIFLASIGPFALMGQLPQLFSRLFPFTRGLNHAYWAPNAWALVTAFDRLLLKCWCPDSLCSNI